MKLFKQNSFPTFFKGSLIFTINDSTRAELYLTFTPLAIMRNIFVPFATTAFTDYTIPQRFRMSENLAKSQFFNAV